MKKKIVVRKNGATLDALTVRQLLEQQEFKVKELARIIKRVPWTKEEFDTDSTVPYELFATPITILTGGDWWKPEYHFLDGQGDNSGVLPKGILSVMKLHGKGVFNIEVGPRRAFDTAFRDRISKLGGQWNNSKSSTFKVSLAKFQKAFDAACMK